MTQEHEQKLIDRHFHYLYMAHAYRIVLAYALCAWVVLCFASPYVGLIESVIMVVLMERKRKNVHFVY